MKSEVRDLPSAEELDKLIGREPYKVPAADVLAQEDELARVSGDLARLRAGIEDAIKSAVNISGLLDLDPDEFGVPVWRLRALLEGEAEQ